MAKPNVIYKRLQKLDEYLAILRSLQQYDLPELLENPERYGSVERFLHLTIEAINDLGNHVIADDDLGKVNWYSDIPRILAENGLIDDALSETWIKMVGFRNILVHDYVDIDHVIVHNVLQNHLQEFEAIRKFFAQFL